MPSSHAINGIRSVANASPCHQLHHIGDAVLRRAYNDGLRHKLGDANVGSLAPKVARP